ncbi:MAG: hypothetical protein AAF841_11105 [Pseudomonadota bacterium]
MSRPLIAVLASLALWALGSALLLMPGGLSITRHTGDALHMIAIVERMSLGQTPHIDFMTPIGALAFWPISSLDRYGMEAGQAFVTAQVILAFMLGAMALFIGLKRAGWPYALALSLLVIILVLALVHGEARPAVSVSMHYNRWAWAMAFICLFAALLPSRGGGLFDGLIIGALLAGLVLIKVTYVAALAPLIALGLILTGQRAAFLVAVATGLAIAGALTLALGMGYWAAYLGDLLAVAGSSVRPQPGLDFIEILTAPAFLFGTLTTLALVAALRRGGFESEGLFVLILLGGASYITYQNFGNDPQWLALLALLAAVWASEAPEEGARPALQLCAVALLAIAAPSFVNMLASPVRHAQINLADYTPILEGGALHQDMRMSTLRANRLRADVALERGFEPFDASFERAPALFQGEPLPVCATEPIAGYFSAITEDLGERGLAQGQGIFTMDILNPYWLYGDHRALDGGTPWYYGDLAGLADAQFVLLPSCPLRMRVRDLIAEELAEVPMTEVARTPMYRLFRLESGES